MGSATIVTVLLLEKLPGSTDKRLLPKREAPLFAPIFSSPISGDEKLLLGAALPATMLLLRDKLALAPVKKIPPPSAARASLFTMVLVTTSRVEVQMMPPPSESFASV